MKTSESDLITMMIQIHKRTEFPNMLLDNEVLRKFLFIIDVTLKIATDQI